MPPLWPAVFLICWRLQPTLAEGNVGCLFSSRLCEQDEACYDDNAFGRCQSGYHPSRDSYRHLLGPETLRLLEHEMRRLFSGGYRWSHEYTQCVVQNILDSERHQRSYDPGYCARIMQLTLPSVPEEIIKELESVDPEDMAFIRFHPSKADDDENVYADEEFVPPIFRERDEGEFADRIIDKRKKDSDFRNANKKENDEANEAFLRYLMQVAQDAEGLLNENQGSADRLPVNKVPVIKTDLSSDLNLRPAFSEGGVEWLPVEDSSTAVEDGVVAEDKDAPWLANIENHDEDDGAQLLQALSQNKDDVLAMSDWPPGGDAYGNAQSKSGGDGWIKDKQDTGGFGEDSMDINEPLLEDAKNMPTFQRPLRYDIKKPGPGYYVHEQDSTERNNNEMPPLDGKLLYRLLHAAQKDQLNTLEETRAKSSRFSDPVKDIIDDELDLKELLPAEQPESLASAVAIETDAGARQHAGALNRLSSEYTDSSQNGEAQEKRNYRPEPAGPVYTSAPPAGEEQLPDFSKVNEGPQGHFEAVDATHAYLLLEESPTSAQGEELVQKLEQILRLPRGSFSNVRTEKSQVTFKVNPNPQGLNASDVAARAEELQTELKDSTGLTVVAAGIGDKVKFEVVGKSNDRRLFILTFVLCGGVVGILIAVVVVYVVRRHARSRQKLQTIAHPETEASQDYQDLCRQRMASKNNEKPEPIHAVQSPKRIRSMSQGDPQQQSSSSHSSTSSWNEEPVISNMDISTGHMILSYMEDHLKNKDRLDREWEALCAYEAEPCSTSGATLPQNIKKNRYTDVLPYDHSRVILNELSSVSGADYINASTITDHDPRNPAYISTQGPLPHTAADFWQMIWEQGSVVIVMLTRLMENGVAMCHRYWPEEGSEVYHIYEVHLVSEHIWCDDYLVRSFYLKNLRTSETRTVTQFHFLSWPDNGVPSSTKALLEFRRKVNKSYRGRSCPVMVHCSDGIGRTGTYCLIDMVLNRMAKGTKEIDIAATLEHIRDQRGGMVKTKAQFEFVLMAVAEEVHAILRALSQ